MWAAMIIGWIVLIVSAWRLMKAHESIADTMQQIAATMNRRP